MEILSILKADAALVTERLDGLLRSDDKLLEGLYASVRYSALGGGKRIRPALTLELSKMLGGDTDAALTLAAAVEMVHTYSLIHDDLPCMDNDTERRGKPTNHVVYGEATALLAGDALLTGAFSVICGERRLTPEQRVRAVALLSECAGIDGMIGGQHIDLMGERCPLDRDEHTKMNSLKTGALIRCAALMGCIAADADENAFRAAEEYAKNVGLAFQVLDDILDYGEEDGKTTYLTFMTADEARMYASELTDKAIGAISGYAGSESLIALAEHLRTRSV